MPAAEPWLESLKLRDRRVQGAEEMAKVETVARREGVCRGEEGGVRGRVLVGQHVSRAGLQSVHQPECTGRIACASYSPFSILPSSIQTRSRLTLVRSASCAVKQSMRED